MLKTSEKNNDTFPIAWTLLLLSPLMSTAPCFNKYLHTNGYQN